MPWRFDSRMPATRYGIYLISKDDKSPEELMRTISTLIVTALLFTYSLVGEEPADKHSRAAEQTVEGCLSKTGNTYVILGGDQPKQYRIVGGDVLSFKALRGKIGHTVRVTGKLGESDGVENVAPPYNEGSTTGVTYSTLVINSARERSSNCSYPGSGK